jgi:hypothetical protein
MPITNGSTVPSPRLGEGTLKDRISGATLAQLPTVMDMFFFRWGLSQLVQNDSLRRRKVLSASLVSGPRDENPTRLVGQIIENAFEMEQVALLNGTLPISRLDNYFVLDSTLLKLPIHINLMR